MNKELFDITGMTCSACANRISKAVSALDGVTEANVNLLKNSLHVTFDGALTDRDIIAAVEKVGYGASLHHKPNAEQTPPADPITSEIANIKQRLIISLIFTLPLFYIAMGHMIGLPIPHAFMGTKNALAFTFTQFLLALPTLMVNVNYYKVGFKTLLSGAPNMDSLIAIGSGAATLFGVYAIYQMAFAMGQQDMAKVQQFASNLYFESAAMILTLITLGKFLEVRAKGKTSEAISKLMDLTPKTALVIRNGVEQQIATEQLQLGDIIIVKTGESTPVDGVITEGNGYLDESAITGESVPIKKQVGDKVIGVTLNKAGHFLMKATRVGEDTTLAQIIQLVDEATSSKAPIARLADKISGVFVPIVISIALLATVVWLLLGYDFAFALSIGIAILVISCPCALGLATPTAIMVGTGRGAANGILVKFASAIETAQAIDTIVVDKTGTITEGKPQVTDLITVANQNSEQLLAFAASLEKLSEHPLGQAIVQEADKQQLPLQSVTDFTQTAGQGISGVIDNHTYYAGNLALLKAQAIPLPSALQQQALQLANEAKTVLYFACEKQLLGIIAIADKVKTTSQHAISELLALGLDVIMLTGDNAKTAKAVQAQLGIKQVIAEVLPQDKEFHIRTLQQQGHKVAMVGDGINDAPALARADVGIAIGAGTDIAIESADIVLMKSDLLDVVTAIQLSKAVMRNIKQNLFWAFIYNIVGIPVAAGVFYGVWGLTLNPMIAAAAMSLSSVSVVSNALRLRFFKPHLTSTQPALIRQVEQASPLSSPLPAQRSSSMKKTIHIEGMSCGHCTGSVTKALNAIPGVKQVVVDLATKTATLEAANNVTDDTLTHAITALDFKVTAID